MTQKQTEYKIEATVNGKTDTELICAAIKDHPAVFTYMNHDEAFLQSADPHDDLRNTYIAIRNNDPNHPVITTEQGSLNDAINYVDILGIDPYPADSRDPLTYVAERVENGIELGDGIKPVYAVLQA